MKCLFYKAFSLVLSPPVAMGSHFAYFFFSYHSFSLFLIIYCFSGNYGN
jgi:hypothetical protein